MNVPNATQQANRRASMRRPSRRTIRVQCRRGALGLGPNLGSAYLNISETGVQVETSTLLITGEEVEVVLDGFGMRGPFKRVGNVRWVTPLEGGGCRAGVNFQKPLSFRDVQNLSAP